MWRLSRTRSDMRRPIFAANWKMNHGPRETGVFTRDFLAAWHAVPSGVEVVVCPPFVDLSLARDAFAGRPIALGGQNCYTEPILRFSSLLYKTISILAAPGGSMQSDKTSPRGRAPQSRRGQGRSARSPQLGRRPNAPVRRRTHGGSRGPS